MLAAIAWFGVVLQGVLTVTSAVGNGKTAVEGLATFLSYFTVLTNLLICLTLTFSLAAPSSSLGKWSARPGVVAGIAASITFVALSYHLLLRNTWNPQGAQWLADVLLHYVVPALYVLHWWLNCAKNGGLRWTHPCCGRAPIRPVPGVFIDSRTHRRHLPVSIHRCRQPGVRATPAQRARAAAGVHRSGVVIRRAGAGASRRARLAPWGSNGDCR